MSLLFRTGLALALVLAVTASAAGASEPAVHAAKACHLSASQGKHLGASYVYNLRVHITGCVTGKRVVKAFNRCRKKHGRAGHCHHRVKHFRCHEGKRSKSPAQYSVKVSCRRGKRIVRFGYTQNT